MERVPASIDNLYEPRDEAAKRAPATVQITGLTQEGGREKSILYIEKANGLYALKAGLRADGEAPMFLSSATDETGDALWLYFHEADQTWRAGATDYQVKDRHRNQLAEALARERKGYEQAGYSEEKIAEAEKYIREYHDEEGGRAKTNAVAAGTLPHEYDGPWTVNTRRKWELSRVEVAVTALTEEQAAAVAAEAAAAAAAAADAAAAAMKAAWDEEKGKYPALEDAAAKLGAAVKTQWDDEGALRGTKEAVGGGADVNARVYDEDGAVGTGGTRTILHVVARP